MARIGGDEFVVLMAHMGDQQDKAVEAASAIARKLLDAVSAPYCLAPLGSSAANGVITHHCTTSMGVSAFCKDALTTQDLIKRAAAAM